METKLLPGFYQQHQFCEIANYRRWFLMVLLFCKLVVDAKRTKTTFRYYF